jgi:hypothetical protein
MFADVHFEIPSSEFQNQAIKDRHLPAGNKAKPDPRQNLTSVGSS